MELVPQAVELGALGVIEDEAGEGFVLAVEQGEGDDFVDGDDFGVAEGGGEHVAKLGQGVFEFLAGLASLGGEDGEGGLRGGAGKGGRGS